MSLDERGTVAALDAARKVFRSSIEANQGRVIDMAGDSVLAVFETATGAVTTALAVQSELAALAVDLAEDLRLRFRIGVHLGDVIEKIDGTVYGDGVNIAARLEGLAGAGGVTVSDAVYGAVRGKVIASFEDQGEQQVKNITYPMRVYAVSELATPTPALPQGEWEKHPARPPTPARGSGSEASELPCATIARGGDGPGTPPAPFAGKPSIAVMAFDNMNRTRHRSTSAKASARTSLPTCPRSKGSASSAGNRLPTRARPTICGESARN